MINWNDALQGCIKQTGIINDDGHWRRSFCVVLVLVFEKKRRKIRGRGRERGRRESAPANLAGSLDLMDQTELDAALIPNQPGQVHVAYPT